MFYISYTANANETIPLLTFIPIVANRTLSYFDFK